MYRALAMAAVGLIAQLVDGATGMAYGVSSTSLMLLLGCSPLTASASVHLAEVVTTALSGLSHWRFGNVEPSFLRALALPGAAGAFVGAAFLARLPAQAARPYVALLLMVAGLRILWRFAGTRAGHKPSPSFPSAPVPAWVRLLGLGAGFADAVGGGGWGPLTTPALLAGRHLEPRKVVGSVDAAEFVVSVAATAGFLVSAGLTGFDPAWVGALVAGGAVAAPLAAWLVSRLPPAILGVCVGGVLVATNARSLLQALDAPVPAHLAAYLAVAAVWGASVAGAFRHRHARARRGQPARSAPTPAGWLRPSRSLGCPGPALPLQWTPGRPARPRPKPATALEQRFRHGDDDRGVSSPAADGWRASR